jgi:sterol 24-C-methyltransferase
LDLSTRAGGVLYTPLSLRVIFLSHFPPFGMSEEKERLLAHSSIIQSYYYSLESRIGYRLFLNGTRHFGYYPTSTSFPIPIGPALRAMEDQLYAGLKCLKGSKILDAGCGVGHVALHMAKKGDYKIECIDLIEHHTFKAKQNIKRAGMESNVSVRLGDYHDLREFGDEDFDGIYTMETFVHATRPQQALREFLRVLKPGGHIAMNEYDHLLTDNAEKDFVDSWAQVNKYAAMPANDSFQKDKLKELLEEAGFEDVQLRDMSDHIVPMLKLFYVFAIIPYLIIRFFGLEQHFINTVAGAQSYRGRHLWRYVQVTGRKPIQ